MEGGVFSVPRPFPSQEHVKYCMNLLVPVSIKRSHILKKTYNLRVSLNTCDLLLNTNAHGHFSTMTSGLKRLLVYLVFQSKTSKIFFEPNRQNLP